MYVISELHKIVTGKQTGLGSNIGIKKIMKLSFKKGSDFGNYSNIYTKGTNYV
jgi:hypothetical protein